jgi:hypothetical protein
MLFFIVLIETNVENRWCMDGDLSGVTVVNQLDRQRNTEYWL